MKTYILKALSYALDFIGLTFSLPGVIFISIGFLFSDWADSLKHIS